MQDELQAYGIAVNYEVLGRRPAWLDPFSGIHHCELQTFKCTADTTNMRNSKTNRVELNGGFQTPEKKPKFPKYDTEEPGIPASILEEIEYYENFPEEHMPPPDSEELEHAYEMAAAEERRLSLEAKHKSPLSEHSPVTAVGKHLQGEKEEHVEEIEEERET